jgi:putative copper resistance protein D
VTESLVIDPLILVRSVHFAATALAGGTVFFMLLIADVAALHSRLNAMIWGALALAIVSGAAWLVLLAADILGGSMVDVCLHGGAWQVAIGTRFGMVWGARFALALLLGLLMLWPKARVSRLIMATLLVALLAFIGHAGAKPGLAGNLHLASDIVHLMAASAWLGGLPALVLLLSKEEPSIADATRRFSRLGSVCVGALVASGAINSWNLLGAPSDLLTTDYGRWLSCKIGLFGAMLCLAAVNRYRLTRLLPAPAAVRALRRNSLYEIGLGLGVLLIVGMLGTMIPTAHVHSTPAGIPPNAAFVHIHTAEAMADVTIDPGRAGTASVVIRVSREDFTEFPAKEVQLALDPPGNGAGGVEGAARRMSDGTWRIDRLEIGQPGIWAASVIVTSEAGKSIVLNAPVVIDR